VGGAAGAMGEAAAAQLRAHAAQAEAAQAAAAGAFSWGRSWFTKRIAQAPPPPPPVRPVDASGEYPYPYSAYYYDLAAADADGEDDGDAGDYDTEGGGWSSANCWVACGGAGACNGFCGSGFSCCESGWPVPGCPVHGGCSGYHCCVRGVPLQTGPQSPSPLCSEGCGSSGDGRCDDGGEGADFGVCALGTDCEDCGPRLIAPQSTLPLGTPPPPYLPPPAPPPPVVLPTMPHPPAHNPASLSPPATIEAAAVLQEAQAGARGATRIGALTAAPCLALVLLIAAVFLFLTRNGSWRRRERYVRVRGLPTTALDQRGPAGAQGGGWTAAAGQRRTAARQALATRLV
jgi:hypothetical protein